MRERAEALIEIERRGMMGGKTAEQRIQHIPRRRARGLRPVVEPIPRRWDDDPSLPSSEVKWVPITFNDPSPPSDPGPSTIDPGGGSSGGGGADGSY